MQDPSAGSAAPRGARVAGWLISIALFVGAFWFFWPGGGEPPLRGALPPRASVRFLTGFAEAVGAEEDAAGLPMRIRRVKDGGTMALVPKGQFEMGGSGARDEEPRRTVMLTRPYYMDETEVTVRAFTAFCRETKRAEPTWLIAKGLPEGVVFAPYPAHGIDREESLTYARWVGATLPTEAQWERAAKGGQVGWTYPWGRDPAAIPPGTATDRIGPVGGSLPNPFGLKDLAGNVAEWCLDGYDAEAYARLPTTDPLGAPGVFGVARGGSGKAVGLATAAERFRASRRLALRAAGRYDDVGFRCAFAVP